MDHYLKLIDANGREYDVPVQVSADRLTFNAEQPTLAGKWDITEVRLISDYLVCPIRFILTSFCLEEESGDWMVTVSDDELGLQEYHLEYNTVEKFGEKVKHSVMMQWDHEKDEMRGN
jgi:hypothetical protein